MVWFSSEVVTTYHMSGRYLARLRKVPLADSDDDAKSGTY